MRKVRLVFLGLAGCLIVGGSVVSWALWSQTAEERPQTLPAAITAQVSGFRLYFFNRPLPANFVVDTEHVVYDAGILDFQAKNTGGQTITITEQALPPDLTNATPQGDQAVSGTSGRAATSIRSNRRVGALITKDNKTLVSVTAASTIDSNTFQDIMRNLQPM